MNIPSSVNMESIGHQLSDPEINMRSIPIFNATNFITIGNRPAETKVSTVICILSVEINVSYISRVVLFRDYQSVLRNICWFITPNNFAGILHQNVILGWLLGFVIGYVIGDVGTQNISIQLDKQFAWIVGIVILRFGQARGPQWVIFTFNELKLKGKSANSRLLCVIVFAFSFYENSESLLHLGVGWNEADGRGCKLVKIEFLSINNE